MLAGVCVCTCAYVCACLQMCHTKTARLPLHECTYCFQLSSVGLVVTQVCDHNICILVMDDTIQHAKMKSRPAHSLVFTY